MASDKVGALDNDTPDGQAGPVAIDSSAEPQLLNDASTCSSSAAAAVVLDKLAGLDVARRAERERRREESRAAADPRESVARFLRSFAARQRNIDEALQRMLLSQGQQPRPTLQQPQQPSASPASSHQPQQPQQPATPSESADLNDAPEPVPLAVSTATPELVQSSLELVSAEVLSLERAAAAASYYLPPYDQKQCAAAVAALRAAIEAARASLVPRRRFAFGSKKVSKVSGEEVSSAAAAAAPPPPAAERDAAGGAASHPSSAAAAGVRVPSISAPADADGAAASAAPNDDAPVALTVSAEDRALVARGRGLLGLSDATVVLSAEEVSEGGLGGDFVLLGLTRCRVVLVGRLRALRVAGLRGCSVVAGPVTGACFVDDVRGSSLALATYQVRVHRTSRTDLFLRVRSKPIIEHSTAIRVAPWSAGVAPEPRLERLMGAHMLGEETGCWQQVDDFGWIKAVQSPNWRVLLQEEYPREPLAVPEAVWGAPEAAGTAAAATAAAAAGRTPAPAPAGAGVAQAGGSSSGAKGGGEGAGLQDGLGDADEI